MKFLIFIFMVCTVCNAFGGNVIYLTSREQLSLKIASNALPDNESLESYKVGIEDKKNLLRSFFMNLMRIFISKVEAVKCMYIMLILKIKPVLW